MTIIAPTQGRVSSALPLGPWDWAARAVAGGDVTLLADLGSAAAIAAQGGLLATPTNAPQSPSDFTFGAGKYTGAMKPAGTNQGNFVQYPLDGLGRGDEFTVAFWAMHPTLAWDAASGRLLTISGVNFTIPVSVGAGALSGTIALLPSTPAGTPGKASPAYTQSIVGLGLTAGTYHHVAVTLSGGSLRFYINGALIKTVAGITVPDHLTDTTTIGGGLVVGGTTSGPSGFWTSDLVVYRAARTPGQPGVRRSLDGHVTFDTTTRTAITPGVIGALHPPLAVGMDADLIHDAVRVIRTDKLVNATPMKAGAPDTTRPTLGQSGLYSYDWQVVDRSISEIVRFGCRPYISIDSSPEILGGSAPMSGTDLTTKTSHWASFPRVVPNDITAWGHIIRDLVHRITVTNGWEVALWSFWNEPDGISWPGTQAQYLDFYEATANAIRAIDPFDAPIGGPELAGLLINNTWVDALMARCSANGTPLDFIAHHDYSGDVANIDTVRAIVDKYAVDHGYATPFPLAIGEFNWNSRYMHQIAEPRGFFEADFFHTKAFGAAFTAAVLCRTLGLDGILGFAYSHVQYFSPRDGGFAVDQLLGPNSEKWGTYNAMKGMQMIVGDKRLAMTDNLPPGIHAYGGYDTATGRVGVVIASFGFANRATRTVHLHLPGMTGNKRLRRYLVDETHSSRWDTHEDDPAGSIDNELVEVEDRTAAASALRDIDLTVPRWSAQFLTLDPA